MTFERNNGIWISDIHRDRLPQLYAWYWDSFLFHCCSSETSSGSDMYIKAVSSHSLWYLVSGVKDNPFHIWICWNVEIFTHKGTGVAAGIVLCVQVLCVLTLSCYICIDWTVVRKDMRGSTSAYIIWRRVGIHLHGLECNCLNWRKVWVFLMTLDVPTLYGLDRK